MKLNQREQSIIKAMQDGERCLYFPYSGRFNPNEYYHIGGIGKCTREIKKFIKNGLVSNIKKGFGDYVISLTDEGKNFVCDLEEPYDVWVVESGWDLKVNKYSGFLNKSTLTLANGSTARETSDRKFFLNRDEAFDHAKSLQNSKIRIAKSKVVNEENTLQELQNQYTNPDLDKAGYL